MKKIASNEMTFYVGGKKSPCSAEFGKAGAIITVVGTGLFVVGMAASGPIGLVVGSLSWSVGGVAAIMDAVNILYC